MSKSNAYLGVYYSKGGALIMNCSPKRDLCSTESHCSINDQKQRLQSIEKNTGETNVKIDKIVEIMEKQNEIIIVQHTESRADTRETHILLQKIGEDTQKTYEEIQKTNVNTSDVPNILGLYFQPCNWQ